jgi:hypothetical protein
MITPVVEGDVVSVGTEHLTVIPIFYDNDSELGTAAPGTIAIKRTTLVAKLCQADGTWATIGGGV